MTNIIKFQSPFERLKDNNHNPETALIKAIILQAIIDATNISKCSEARKNEIDAKTWLYGGGEDFQSMCEYVHCSVSNVRKIARDIEKLHKNSSIKKDRIKKKQSLKNPNIMEEELLYEKIRVRI